MKSNLCSPKDQFLKIKRKLIAVLARNKTQTQKIKPDFLIIETFN